MYETLLFTDGSVNPQLKIGFGAYLIVENASSFLQNSNPNINVKRFDNTSSTKLEIEILLFALKQFNRCPNNLIIYTDCQNLIDLKIRCEKFEKNSYLTKKNKLIPNHLLYKEFYHAIKDLNCKFIKVSGHKPTKEKNEIDLIFTRVDRAARDALREFCKLPL